MGADWVASFSAPLPRLERTAPLVPLRIQALAKLLRVLPRTRISRAVGQLCELQLPRPLSRALVGAYARAYDVDLGEAAPLNGHGAYRSFDAFFTRPLRVGARPRASAAALASPADGRVLATGTVTEQGVIAVKGSAYRTAELLGSDAEARRYRGGRYAVIYLSPRDYHRVHAPVTGELREVRSYPGELLPVNSMGRRSFDDVLAHNRRVALPIDVPAGSRVTVVMVAALVVGRVTTAGIAARDVPYGAHSLRPPLAVNTGDEIGIFHLGSTVVLFVQATMASALCPDLGPIRVGMPLGAEQARPPITVTRSARGRHREDPT